MLFSIKKSGWAVFFCLLYVIEPAYSKYAEIESHDIDCLTRVLHDQKTQINVKRVCPKLYAALWQNQLTETFEFPLSNQVTQAQLRLLEASIKLSERPRLLDDSKLNELLAEIYIVKPEDQSNAAWKQFIAWLNSFKPERYEAEFNWLIKILETLTPSIESARIIMYLVFGLIILLAVGLLVRELYLSGIFVRGKRKAKADASQPRYKMGEPIPTLSLPEIKRLGPKIQITTLLKHVIEYLVNHEGLPKNAALTNFELKRCLQQQKSASANAFSMILSDVEPVLYGNTIPSEQALERCWHYVEQIVNS